MPNHQEKQNKKSARSLTKKRSRSNSAKNQGPHFRLAFPLCKDHNKDSDPYRLNSFHPKKADPRDHKSGYFLTSGNKPQRIKTEVKSGRKKEKKSKRISENIKPGNEYGSSNSKSQKKCKRKNKLKVTGVTNAESVESSESLEEVDSDPLKQYIMFQSNQKSIKERNHSATKISDRLKPKVKDPFEKRMRLQQVFKGTSIISKIARKQQFVVDESDRHFLQLMKGLK